MPKFEQMYSVDPSWGETSTGKVHWKRYFSESAPAPIRTLRPHGDVALLTSFGIPGNQATVPQAGADAAAENQVRWLFQIAM